MIGTTVSHYRILEKVGVGGMGVVYRAEDIRLGRGVALKFLPVDRSRDVDALDRFEREARIASALNHPNICTLYEIGEHEERPFLVMELLEGETLDERLAASPLDDDLLLELATQLADGLEAAHGADIVHRDIKPANLFVTSQGYLKILDFGLAKLADGRLQAPSSGSNVATAQFPQGQESASLTQPGFTMGTVAYMSPEQVRGEEIDARSDIFSAGAVLYEMATGEQPFQGATTGAVWDAILHQAPPPPHERRDEVPPGFERIIAKAIEKDPALRYQSAADLRADLMRLRRDSQSRAPAVGTRWAQPPADPHPIAKRLPAITLLLAAFAALATGIWWLASRETGPPVDVRAVAVLPFQNLTGEPELDHLHLAVPDEVATVLSRTPSLVVRPFAMTRSYEDVGSGAARLGEIGREVGVTRVVTGHYAREEEALRLTLEAIDLESHQVLWRESLTVPGDDMLALREHTASRVREELLPILDHGHQDPGYQERVPLDPGTGTVPTSGDAYDLFLRALAMRDDARPGRVAIEMLERAAELDPGYAPIWMELAFRLHTQSIYGGAPGAAERALRAAERALALDPKLLGAASTSILLHTESGDLVSARRQAAEVAALRPGDAAAHFTLGYVLRYGGALSEANDACEAALRLEPSNRRIRSCAISFYLSGDYDRALDFIQLDAGSEWARVHTVQVRLRSGERTRVLELVDQLPDWSFSDLVRTCFEDPGSPELPELAAPLLAERTAARDPELKYHAAATFAFCGQREEALDLLAQAIDGGYCSYPAIELDPLWRPLDGDPEMISLAGRSETCQKRFAAAG